MVILTPQVADDATANQMAGFMFKALFAALLAAGLIAAPLPALLQTAAAQTAQPADQKQAKAKKPPTAAQLAERERIKKCGEEWKAAKARRQGREGNEVAAILERVQQAPQRLRLTRRATRAF
jgi:hypothetical protein